MSNANSSDRTTAGTKIATTNGPLKPGKAIPAGQSARDSKPSYSSGPKPANPANNPPGKYNPGLPVGSNGLNARRPNNPGATPRAGR